MKNTLISICTLVAAVTLVIVLPKYILLWIGCFQLGSWAGDIANKFRSE
jgi:hypothetical protein